MCVRVHCYMLQGARSGVTYSSKPLCVHLPQLPDFERCGCFQDCPKTRLLEGVDAYAARVFSVLALSSRGTDRCALGLCFCEVILTRRYAPQSYAKLLGAAERRQGSAKIVNTHVVTTQQHRAEGTTAGMHITHQLLFSWDLTQELPGRW